MRAGDAGIRNTTQSPDREKPFGRRLPWRFGDNDGPDLLAIPGRRRNLIDPVERQFALTNVPADGAFRLLRGTSVDRETSIDRQNDRS